ADGATTGGEGKHPPGDSANTPSYKPDGLLDKPINRSIVLRDSEQVSDTDERDKYIAGTPCEDFPRRQVGKQSDYEGTDKCERSHVNRQHGRDDKHHRETDDGGNLR